MAYQGVTRPAAGDAKSITSPTRATPAPIGEVPPPGDLGNRNDPNRGDGYGRNGFGGASSIAPGTQMKSDFSVQPKDDVLARVQAQGLRRDDNITGNDQLRDIGRGNVPTAFGHRNPNAAPNKVPGSIDKNATENPVRKPGA